MAKPPERKQSLIETVTLLIELPEGTRFSRLNHDSDVWRPTFPFGSRRGANATRAQAGLSPLSGGDKLPRVDGCDWEVSLVL